MNTAVVIPARYGSTRFGGKVLAKDTGKFLVQHTWERACCCRKAGRVLIATDSEVVREACKSFGAECVMTRADHQSGTDRIAEAVRRMPVEIVVNVQADEPEIDPGQIDLLIELLEEHPDADMATLVTPLTDPAMIADPNVVKAVVDGKGRAMYFSRAVIPFDRQAGGVGAGPYLRHLGIYGYRKEFLLRYSELPASRLEQVEKLEQLRALENGFTILTAGVDHVAEGIDTPQQYEAFVQRYRKSMESKR